MQQRRNAFWFQENDEMMLIEILEKYYTEGSTIQRMTDLSFQTLFGRKIGAKMVGITKSTQSYNLRIEMQKEIIVKAGWPQQF